MFLKYIGRTKGFKTGDLDFTDGPAEVDTDEGLRLLKENPSSFVAVEKVTKAQETPKTPAKK